MRRVRHRRSEDFAWTSTVDTGGGPVRRGFVIRTEEQHQHALRLDVHDERPDRPERERGVTVEHGPIAAWPLEAVEDYARRVLETMDSDEVPGFVARLREMRPDWREEEADAAA